jgi:YgiT-type zinc finger domain-containing protein
MTMVCDVCGKKGARIRRLTRNVGKGKTAFLIEGVPVVSCPRCGESYLTAETLREIERIRLHRKQLTKDRVVPVARFGGAA